MSLEPAANLPELRVRAEEDEAEEGTIQSNTLSLHCSVHFLMLKYTYFFFHYFALRIK